MKEGYKKLGKYIQQVNIRNRDLEMDTLLGVSITKKLIPSIANTIGTDMSVYKIIEKRQFAYGTVTSRNGEKISIALADEYDKALVSQIYVVFEVIDTNVLLPEYLMMWFSRPEFDRYARFHSHGSTRETFDWADLCETELPILSIDKQRELVEQYQSISNKIKVNEQICEKLEVTAQTLYRQWFVDFEFPNEDGKPYKSSGGSMVFDEELDGEIPEEWTYDSFTTISKIGGGGTPKTDVLEYWGDGEIPFYTPGDKTSSIYVLSTDKHITKEGLKKCSSKLYPANTTFVTARGATTGGISLSGFPMAMNQTCYAILSLSEFPFFTYFLTRSVIDKLKSEAIGATFEAVVTKNFDETFVIIPKNEIVFDFEEQAKSIYETILNKTKINHKLSQLQSLLLSRLATLENGNFR